MALFEKKNCSRCGKELGLIFGKIKVADGLICKDCNALLSPLLTGKSKLTLAQIEEHLTYRKQNKTNLASFKATTILGNKTKFYFDEAKSTFLISTSNDFVKNNADIFRLSDISSAVVNKDEEEEEIFKVDKDGNEVSYDPARYKYLVTYSVEVSLNHKWIKEFTVQINDEAIDKSAEDELLEADNLANEICAKLLNKTYSAKTSTSTTSSSIWICSKCGATNEANAKFCTDCGEAKATTAKYCSECGTKLESGIKFCPNCGKAVS